MLLECLFHFFGTKLSEYAYAVVVNIHQLNTLAVKVSRRIYDNSVNKFVYQFGREFLELGNFLYLVNEFL